MSLKNILTDIEDHILLITINRPEKYNALDKATLSEFENAIQMAYDNPKIYGVIVTGEGENSFISGADIAEFSKFSEKQGREWVENGHRVLKLVEDSEKPVIAAINGYALGGGCELAMACHLRIASENAIFGQPEVKLGIIPGYGGSQRLVQLIGKAKATELILTGMTISAEEALSAGLINQVTRSGELISTAKKLMHTILQNSPNAVGKAIQAINGYFDHSKDGFKSELDEFEKCFGSNEFYEGVDAFLKKRPPNFRT